MKSCCFLPGVLLLATAAASAAPVKIGFYQGNGTSHPHHNDGFLETLSTAATTAFGGKGFSITNLTEAAVQALKPGDFSVLPHAATARPRAS